MKKMDFTFVISETGGEILIKFEPTHGELQILWRGLPSELTMNIMNQYNISKDDVSYDYVKMVHQNYGTIQIFEDFQPKFKGFLKHLRTIK